jgi:fructose 5-dehydrogenase large subunit
MPASNPRHRHSPIAQLSTSVLFNPVSGCFERMRHSFFTTNYNFGFGRNRFITFAALKKGFVGKALDEDIRRMTACTADIVVAHEMLPDPNNRMTLSDKKDWLGLPKPAIHYDVGDYVRKCSDTYSVPIGRRIAEAMGAIDVKATPKFVQSKHIMGGTIMGADPASSVVDVNCRSHDHENLFLPGGGAMPSTACGNSTITMTALTFKAANAITSQMRGG